MSGKNHMATTVSEGLPLRVLLSLAMISREMPQSFHKHWHVVALFNKNATEKKSW